MKLLDQARLAQPRLADDHYQLPVALPRTLPAPHQHCDFFVATDQRCEMALTRTASPTARTHDPEQRHRLRHAFELMAATFLGYEQARDLPLNPRRHDDRTRLGQRLRPRGDIWHAGSIAPHALRARHRSPARPDSRTGPSAPAQLLGDFAAHLRHRRRSRVQIGPNGKTVEAGLVARELLLRRRIDYIVISAPAAMTAQWKAELESKFGLTFDIVDRERIHELRRIRGFPVNPWTTGSRFILSHSLLAEEDYVAGLRDVLGDFRSRALFILDEAHHAAPSGGGRYAISSQLTRAVRELSACFEHRLFLTATPHNGHSNSFSALLEMLDPQRFTRGVDTRPKDLEPVMVHKLASCTTCVARCSRCHCVVMAVATNALDHGLAAHVRVFNSDALLVEHAKATSVQRASAAFEPLRVPQSSTL
jgi:hypothetical protein